VQRARSSNVLQALGWSIRPPSTWSSSWAPLGKARLTPRSAHSVGPSRGRTFSRVTAWAVPRVAQCLAQRVQGGRQFGFIVFTVAYVSSSSIHSMKCVEIEDIIKVPNGRMRLFRISMQGASCPVGSPTHSVCWPAYVQHRACGGYHHFLRGTGDLHWNER
jgi:hypothetical protein